MDGSYQFLLYWIQIFTKNQSCSLQFYLLIHNLFLYFYYESKFVLCLVFLTFSFLYYLLIVAFLPNSLFVKLFGWLISLTIKWYRKIWSSLNERFGFCRKEVEVVALLFLNSVSYVLYTEKSCYTFKESCHLFWKIFS